MISIKRVTYATILFASFLICNDVQAQSNIPTPDTTGDNFMGKIGEQILAPKEQFMPLSYTIFEGNPGAAAVVSGTPLYSRSAVTAIIESVRNLTVIPKTAVKSGNQSVAYFTWTIFITLSVYGLFHSGILTFLKIAREGAPIGQSVIAYLIKISIVVGMLAWVIGGAPRAMIKIVDLLNGFDQGSIKFESYKGTLTEQDYKDSMDRLKMFNNSPTDEKMDQRIKTAQTQMLPASLMFQNYIERARKEVAKHNDTDAKLPTGSIAALTARLHNISRDYKSAWRKGSEYGAYGKITSTGDEFKGENPKWALGSELNSYLYDGKVWGDNGEEGDVITRSKNIATKLNLAYFPKVYNQVAATLNHTLQNPMHLYDEQVAEYNDMNPTDDNRLIALFGKIPVLEQAPGMYGPSEAVPDNSAIMLNAFPPNNIDWEEIKKPNSIIESALHTAGLMLGFSIWGLPLALLLWTAMYSLPEQLQIGGVLTKSVSAALTVALTGLMLGGAYAWGCEISHPGYEVVETITNDSETTIPDATIKKGITKLTGSTSGALLLAMYIITIPGIAAKMVQGANGLADGMTKTLDSGGRISKLATGAGMWGELSRATGAGAAAVGMGAMQVGAAALRAIGR